MQYQIVIEARVTVTVETGEAVDVDDLGDHVIDDVISGIEGIDDDIEFDLLGDAEIDVTDVTLTNTNVVEVTEVLP